MAEYKGKQGRWITTKEGRHLFIEEDAVDKQEREIKEREEQTKKFTAEQNNDFSDRIKEVRGRSQDKHRDVKKKLDAYMSLINDMKKSGYQGSDDKDYNDVIKEFSKLSTDEYSSTEGKIDREKRQSRQRIADFKKMKPGTQYYDAQGNLKVRGEDDGTVDDYINAEKSDLNKKIEEIKITDTKSKEAKELGKQALEGLTEEWTEFGRDEQDGIPGWQYVNDDLSSNGFSDSEINKITSGKADYDLTCKFLAFIGKRDAKIATKEDLAKALTWVIDGKISDAVLNDIMKYVK